MEYNVISTDDHMQEPCDFWTRRLSKEKWGNRIPEVRRLPEGQDCWFIWDKPFYKYGAPMIGAVHGVMEERRGAKTWDDIPLKACVPSERVKAMDQDGVDVHAFFGFGGARQPDHGLFDTGPTCWPTGCASARRLPSKRRCT